MSEIEKMYENAGIEKDRHCTKIGSNCFYQECSKCDYYNYIYPELTAETQLELIKWLLQNKRLCIRKAEYSNNFYMDTIFNRLNGVDNKDFEPCLASLVNNLWQDLTSEEKQQVKGILEWVNIS